MEGYLGEKVVPVEQTPFAGYEVADWTMYFIERYGQIDGDHHKGWVLDQVARLHKGVKPIIALAEWANGHQEWRVSLGCETDCYKKWVKDMKDGEDGPETYDYDPGIAP